METKKSVLQDEDKFMLRMPDGMREKFAQIAKANNRSLNGELIQRLEKSLLVPTDVVEACLELGDVQDRIDLAVKLFARAGISVTAIKK
jgi:formylmethanofuran:tetrahydromethanopterin formyltransferase